MRVVGGVLTLNKDGAIRYQSLEVRFKTNGLASYLILVVGTLVFLTC